MTGNPVNMSGDSLPSPPSSLPSVFDLSIADFTRWNPSVTAECGNFLATRSYCVEAKGEPLPSKDPEPDAGTPSSTSASVRAALTVSPELTPSGIETPSPTQPGLVQDCSKFYLVKPGDQCADIAQKNGITLKEFLTWNPGAGAQCGSLWADAYACVSVLGHKPQPTASKRSSGIQTPVPTQPGMVANCGRFQYVNSGDLCASIAAKAGISVADLISWNPGAGSECKCLWGGTYACVGLQSAFRLKTRYHNDCTGDVYREASVEAGSGICVDTGCATASLEVAAGGFCPDGQVQSSYWEQPGCSGKWFGYGYTSRGKCQGLWRDGWTFKSLHLRCAKQEEDCVSKKECSYEPEPAGNVC